MKLLLDRQEKYTLLELHEPKLDAGISPDFKSELIYLNSEGVRNIIIDLQNVKFVDSSGLSALLVGNRLCKGVNGSFVIARPTTEVKKLMNISQLETIISAVPSVEEAIDLVFIEEIERELGEPSNEEGDE